MNLELFRTEFNNRVAFRPKRPGILQLIAPLYHEDGDMIDIFLEELNAQQVRICDYGMTLMRLSYSFDVDTPNKERIFNRILSENGIREEKGNLFIDINKDMLYQGIMLFAQTVSKVSSMKFYKREVIQSLFYELMEEFINASLARYNPIPKVFPIPERDDLEVDYQFKLRNHPVYLFGIKDAAKARLVAISCLEFQRANLKFKGFAVHEDFDALGRKDRNRITSAIDKQFVSLEDFRKNAGQVFEREAA